MKVSPFVLNDESLNRLRIAAEASKESSVVDLVGYYQRSQADAQAYGEMLIAEMEHFGVA